MLLLFGVSLIIFGSVCESNSSTSGSSSNEMISERCLFNGLEFVVVSFVETVVVTNFLRVFVSLLVFVFVPI